MDLISPQPAHLSRRPDGRHLSAGGPTLWLDGPLAAAVRAGAIGGLDAVVQARQDTLYRKLTH